MPEPLFSTSFEGILFVALVLLWIRSEVVSVRRNPWRGRGDGAEGRKGGMPKNRGSNLLLRISLYGSIIVTFLLAGSNTTRLPQSFFYVGTVLMAVGILVRQWAISTLGRFFDLNLGVQQGQSVVDRGPYHLVRHPSYLGLSLTAIGIGVALRSWGGVLVILVLFGVALWYRMRVEEELLVSELGDDYIRYMRRTKRLIPFVW